MTIKMTKEEIERKSYIKLKATYMMCKNCGFIMTWYVFPTGILPNCARCASCNDFELVEEI